MARPMPVEAPVITAALPEVEEEELKPPTIKENETGAHLADLFVTHSLGRLCPVLVTRSVTRTSDSCRRSDKSPHVHAKTETEAKTKAQEGEEPVRVPLPSASDRHHRSPGCTGKTLGRASPVGLAAYCQHNDEHNAAGGGAEAGRTSCSSSPTHLLLHSCASRSCMNTDVISAKTSDPRNWNAGWFMQPTWELGHR